MQGWSEGELRGVIEELRRQRGRLGKDIEMEIREAKGKLMSVGRGSTEAEHKRRVIGMDGAAWMKKSNGSRPY